MQVRRIGPLVAAAAVLAALVAGCGSGVVTIGADGRWSECGKVPAPTAVAVERTQAITSQLDPLHGASHARRQGPLAGELFDDICRTEVVQVHPTGPISCPADFGLGYTGTFEAAGVTVAHFKWSASGCQMLYLTVAGHRVSTMLAGPASLTTGPLERDLANLMGYSSEATILARVPTAQATPIETALSCHASFAVSLVSDRGGEGSPVAAATWFAAHGAASVPATGWRVVERSPESAELAASHSTLHVVRGSDRTWQVDAGHNCG